MSTRFHQRSSCFPESHCHLITALPPLDRRPLPPIIYDGFSNSLLIVDIYTPNSPPSPPLSSLNHGPFLLTITATINPRLIPPILHYAAPEPYTKFEICLVFSRLLGVPIPHITPDADEPTGAAAVSRPRNCQLYTRETEDLMERAGGLGITGFEEWWADYLGVDKA